MSIKTFKRAMLVDLIDKRFPTINDTSKTTQFIRDFKIYINNRILDNQITINQQQVNNWILGKVEPSAAIRKLLADYFGIDINEFFIL